MSIKFQHCSMTCGSRHSNHHTSTIWDVLLCRTCTVWHWLAVWQAECDVFKISSFAGEGERGGHNPLLSLSLRMWGWEALLIRGSPLTNHSVSFLLDWSNCHHVINCKTKCAGALAYVYSQVYRICFCYTGRNVSSSQACHVNICMFISGEMCTHYKFAIYVSACLYDQLGTTIKLWVVAHINFVSLSMVLVQPRDLLCK